MNLLERYCYGKNDVKLFTRIDVPYKARCIVIIVHGFMEHSGRYVDFAHSLIQHNIGVCLLDLRGNGRSEGPEGEIDDFFDFIDDFNCLVDQLGRYKKLILTFGHSMGGLITFLYGLKYPEKISGQIFSAPALGVPIGCKNLPAAFYESMGTLFAEAKFPRIGEHIATRNETYMKAFRHDEANDYATFHFIDQFLRCGVGYANEHASAYQLPSLFLMGENDYVIPISRNQEILKKMPQAPRVVKEYPGCMHDLLHDLDEEVVKITADILAWIDEHVKSLNNNTD